MNSDDLKIQGYVCRSWNFSDVAWVCVVVVNHGKESSSCAFEWHLLLHAPSESVHVVE